jgi:hypothetical protein
VAGHPGCFVIPSQALKHLIYGLIVSCSLSVTERLKTQNILRHNPNDLCPLHVFSFINGILPSPPTHTATLQKPPSNIEILQKPAFDLFKAGASGNRECLGTPQ